MATTSTDNRPKGGPHIETARFWDYSEPRLRYIIRDAGEALKLNPTASTADKWADEINDAVTVLHFRRQEARRAALRA